MARSKGANNPIVQKNIIKVLKKYNSDIHRKIICKELNIAWTTAYDNLEKLEKRKIVRRRSENNHKPGRPIILWGLI